MIQTSSHVEILEFSLDKAIYGINVAKVLQLVAYDPEKVTEIPGLDDAIIGTTYFRGSPISVVDLKTVLGMGDEKTSEHPLLLVTQFSNHTLGFKIDAVSRIHRLEWSKFEAMNDGVFDAAKTHVLGTIQMDEKVLMVLDVEGVVDQLQGHRGFSESIEKIEEGPAKNIKIVYAEDSTIVRNIAVSAMKKAGFTEILEFPNAVDALKFLEDNPDEKVDFILSDVEMPGLDGLSFCQQLKGNKELGKIPFVFFSSLINPQMRERCMQAGASEALSKPEVSKIIPLIKQHCLSG